MAGWPVTRINKVGEPGGSDEKWTNGMNGPGQRTSLGILYAYRIVFQAFYVRSYRKIKDVRRTLC